MSVIFSTVLQVYKSGRSLCLALLDQGPELSASDLKNVIRDFITFVVEKKLGDSNRQNASASRQLVESLVRVFIFFPA